MKHASGPPAAVKFEKSSLAVLVLMLYAYISERYRSSLCPANMKSVLEVGSRTMECPKREGMMTCEPPVFSACLRWDMISRDREKEGDRSVLQQTPFAKADVVAVQARVL